MIKHMWILCGGKNSKTIAEMCKNRTDVHVQGENLLDIVKTYRIKGKNHFDKVTGIIVLDSSLDSLLDLGPLNELVGTEVPIYFINRYSDAVNNDRIHSGIIVREVEEIYIKNLQALIFRGGRS